MGEGKGLSLYVLIGAIMFGIFVGVGAAAIFGDEEGSFEGGLVAPSPEPNEGEGNLEDDPNCVLATDEDFIDTVNDEFKYIKYIGSSDCVKIPRVIKGVEVTSYPFMFYGTSVSKVELGNPNVTDMSWMFFGSKAKELDLSSFDTSNVTNMSGMFYGSKATDLDLSNFDTSNVTDMWAMFYGSQSTELDLSSFDTSNVTDMMSMFNGSQAKELDLSSFDTSNVTSMSDMFTESATKTVYARTQEDADKYNASLNKPIGLQVIVKQ